MTSFGYRLNPRYAIKECLSCGALYTGDFFCSKGNVEDKILVPKLPKNCARCGHPVNGPYCQECTLLREKLEEDLDALGTKQYKPEDIQELFRQLLNDVQNIHEELAKYINTPGWNRLAFYDDDNDDDVDYTIAITPVLSTEEPVYSLSMGDEHLDTILATKSDEVIKSSVKDLVPIPSEFEGIPDTMCDVYLVNNPTPLEAKDHFEIVINSNDDISSSDDDSLYKENIKYLEASPHDSELVSLEAAKIVIPEVEEIKDDNLRKKLLNVRLLIANIEALKDNPTPSSEFLTKSSSTSPKSFLEETNTFHNSLPEFENLYFDLKEISSGSTTTHSDISLPDYEALYFNDDHIEEISSGSTTTHSDISLPDYEALYFNDDHIEEISSGSTTTHSDISLSEYDSFTFEFLNDQCPPTDRSDFTHGEFVDELAHIISPPEYDCFYFRNLSDPGGLMPILNSGIRENLSSTTCVNLPIEDDHSPLLAYVIWIFLAYLTYPVIPPYLHSFGNEATIFDPGITINHFYSFKPVYLIGVELSRNSILTVKLNDLKQALRGSLLHLAGSQPMLKSSYKENDSVIISIPPLVGGVADVVVEIKGTSFDQTQSPQFPVIHPPPQETSIEILHDQENVINSVQTFLRNFNHYSFFKTPKVLLLAWDRVFEIKDALGTKQYKPEDIQELFLQLLNDVQNIHEELAKYINTLGWNRLGFYDDDNDDDVDYTIAITPVLSTEEPVYSLSMGDEHLDTIPATESDEVIKSSVEDLVPIPSEFEEIVIPEVKEIKDDNLRKKLLNVRLLIANIKALKDNPTPSFEFLTKSSSTSPKSFLEETNTFHNSFPEFENFYFDLKEISSGSTTTHSGISLSDYEAFSFNDDHIEEISSGSTTTHSDISLSEYDSFTFDLSNDQCPPTDRSDFTHGEFIDELAHIISPPEYDCFYFRNLPDPDESMSILNFGIRENLSSTTCVNLPIEDDHSPLLAYVVWIFLAYLTLLHLVGSQPMLKSSYKAKDGVIISIPPLVGGVADVVVEIKGTGCQKPGRLADKAGTFQEEMSLHGIILPTRSLFFEICVL
nr:hypothetical protein [Tanacetum cinerariifolium]